MQKRVLEGIKVLDFSWVAAGPVTTMYLADFGAEVIKIESTKHVDLVRASEPYRGPAGSPDASVIFIHFNTSKYCMTLDLTHPKGVEIAKRLVKWADVVVENFRPGVITRMGLGYEELKKIKPEIIMVSISIAGQGGPYATLAAYGYMGAALSGHYHLTGWPDREPTQCGSIALADPVQAAHATACILAALEYRDRTGRGQYLDISQLEPMVQLIGPAILDYLVNGRQASRMGNRHSYAAPHGVFRCRGDDRWCAIAVFTDDEWRGFCQVIGMPELIDDSRFASLRCRKENEDELEQLIERWTINYSAEEVMGKMQAAGVPAGIVQDASELVDSDPQLKERQSFVSLPHPVAGVCNHPSHPFKLSNTPAEIRTAPLLGQHNEYVCSQILGMSTEEFLQLLQEGCFE